MPTVLLVDDEPSIVETFRYFLECGGYTVLGATSGDSALKVCRCFPETIDILVADMKLAPQDGAQLAAVIRALYPCLTVVLMSGWPADTFSDHSIADGFLEKPFRPSELLEVLSSILRKKSEAASTSKH